MASGKKRKSDNGSKEVIGNGRQNGKGGIKATKQKRPGKEIDQAGKPYEKRVQEATGGKAVIIEGREIDCVTDEALIQAKDSVAAATKPHNFLNKKMRAQIKETIRMAKARSKRAEFWFKNAPHLSVRKYIEDKGGIVEILKG